MDRLRKLDNEVMYSLRSWLNVIMMSRVTQGEMDSSCSTCKEINA
jgi:hypothetical protein